MFQPKLKLITSAVVAAAALSACNGQVVIDANANVAATDAPAATTDPATDVTITLTPTLMDNTLPMVTATVTSVVIPTLTATVTNNVDATLTATVTNSVDPTATVTNSVDPTLTATVTNVVDPTMTATATVTATVTNPATPTATPTVTSPVQTTQTITYVEPTMACPTENNWDSGKSYSQGDQVIYDGHLFEASAWGPSGAPKVGYEPANSWTPYWKDLGALNNEWCQGKAIGAGGYELNMGAWPFPLTRNWKDYDTSSGKQVGAYFADWVIYDNRGFLTEFTPAQSLTHIYYAFLPVCGDNETAYNPGAVASACSKTGKSEFEIPYFYDEWGDVQKNFSGDDYAATEAYAAGVLGQLARLKATNPHVWILPSIGGWTLSRPFYEMAETKAGRDKFVASAEAVLRHYPFFDGIDIDWEFPGGEGNDPDKGNTTPTGYKTVVQDGENFADLMVELRAMLDTLGEEKGKHYHLSAAMSMDPKKLNYVNWDKAAPVMDGINIMTYDGYGGWDNVPGHQTSLYYDKGIVVDGEPKRKDWSIDGAVRKTLIEGWGVASHKINVGVAMYGRGWAGVDMNADPFGPDGRATEGTCENIANSWNAPDCAGWKFMPDPNATHSDGSSKSVSAYFTDSKGQQNSGRVGFHEANIVDYAYIEEHMMGGENGTGINGWEVYYDADVAGAYVYHPGTPEAVAGTLNPKLIVENPGVLISFDNRESTLAKGAYVLEHNLGGLFAWEIDQDSGAILNAMNEGLGNKPE